MRWILTPLMLCLFPALLWAHGNTVSNWEITVERERVVGSVEVAIHNIKPLIPVGSEALDAVSPSLVDLKQPEIAAYTVSKIWVTIDGELVPGIIREWSYNTVQNERTLIEEVTGIQYTLEFPSPAGTIRTVEFVERLYEEYDSLHLVTWKIKLAGAESWALETEMGGGRPVTFSPQYPDAPSEASTVNVNPIMILGFAVGLVLLGVRSTSLQMSLRTVAAAAAGFLGVLSSAPVLHLQTFPSTALFGVILIGVGLETYAITTAEGRWLSGLVLGIGGGAAFCLGIDPAAAPWIFPVAGVIGAAGIMVAAMAGIPIRKRTADFGHLESWLPLAAVILGIAIIF
jgi:hypothetical protein